MVDSDLHLKKLAKVHVPVIHEITSIYRRNSASTLTRWASIPDIGAILSAKINTDGFLKNRQESSKICVGCENLMRIRQRIPVGLENIQEKSMAVRREGIRFMTDFRH
jgi:hypothetical protein